MAHYLRTWCRGFKQIPRLYFMWKLQKPIDQPYLEIMIDQTQHAHVWLKNHRDPPRFSFVTIACICVVFCSVSKNFHIQYLIWSSQQYCEVGKAGIIILILQNRKLDAERLSDLAKVTQMACNRITGFEYTPSDFKFHICSITTSKQKLIISIQQRCWPFLVLKVYTMELSRKIS